MRSTSSSARRLRSRPPRHHRLDAIARVVDEAAEGASGHLLVHVVGEPVDDVELGVRPVPEGSHPFGVLAGFEAPEEWWAFGVRVRGRARFLDDEDRAPEPVATTFLVDRAGGEASLLRAAGEVRPLPGRAEGTIPDLCRRVLGRPTTPPPASTTALWIAVWLDRLMEAWGEPAARRELGSSWSAVARHHPAATAPDLATAPVLDDPSAIVALARTHADAWPWSRLRHHPEVIALPDGPVPGDVAAWMDDGFFARWCLGAYPSPAALAADLRGLLGEPNGTHLLRVLVEILEAS
jgi:hypothetical protein